MKSFECGYVPARTTDHGVAVVIYGLNPIPGQLDGTISTLAESNDVFTYSYGNDVVMGGDPSALPELISKIHADVQDKTASTDPERIRMVGASLGSCVAFNIQKQLGLPLPGIYYAAGVNIARNVMRNPLFLPARKAFVQNEVRVKELDQAWQEIDTYHHRPPLVPGICVVSRLDPVVPYPFAKRNMVAWQEAGSRIKVLPNWAPLHTAAIGHADANIREILSIASLL